jgi:hypothetical protein
MSKLIAFLIAISLSAVTVLADYFIKKSSLLNSVWNKWLLIGALIYGFTAIRVGVCYEKCEAFYFRRNLWG